MEKLEPKLRIMAKNEKMLDQDEAEETNSYYLEGLWINGATWNIDEYSLDECKFNYESSVKLPLVHFSIEKTCEALEQEDKLNKTGVS